MVGGSVGYTRTKRYLMLNILICAVGIEIYAHLCVGLLIGVGLLILIALRAASQ
jgi:hypothetical protein